MNMDAIIVQFSIPADYDYSCVLHTYIAIDIVQ